MPIVGKIDVTKVDKARLFKGAKGTYLDIVLMDSPNNEYGNDYMIVQSVSKEEREKGIKGAILGNAKHTGQRPQQQSQRPANEERRTPPARSTAATENLDEDVPF